jgi:hypothetical protein
MEQGTEQGAEQGAERDVEGDMDGEGACWTAGGAGPTPRAGSAPRARTHLLHLAVAPIQDPGGIVVQPPHLPARPPRAGPQWHKEVLRGPQSEASGEGRGGRGVRKGGMGMEVESGSGGGVRVRRKEGRGG